MRLATRLFLTTALLVLATVVGLVAATDRTLRHGMEADVAAELEHEGRLVAALLPPDSARWPDEARRLGELIGRRVTLVDSRGRVRGDSEFDRASLALLENHADRPEVRAALAAGVGRDRRLSASTNEPQMYVAVRGGPLGLAIVRVSAPLAAVDAQVARVRRAVAGAGALAVLAAALLAWLASRTFARPLVRLAVAARDIAAGRPPAFPDSRIPEIAQHILALRNMHEELAARFADLRREREETHTLVESMSDGIVAANPRGEVVTCNEAARRLLGFRPGAPLPPLGALFHDKRARDFISDVVRGRDVELRELELEDRTVLVTGRALPDGGTLLVLRDVTELRRLETVRRDFVANVSHELKTPLTSIAGYAETLATEAADDTQTGQFAETILSNARRMQRLVDELLDLSRIESGGWRPVLGIVELEGTAYETWDQFAERTRAGAVRFETAVAPEAHAVAVDPDALRQILTNLFDNALRHTPPGGRIRLSAEVGQDAVVVAVTDTGAGIAPEHLPRIFERFYRVDTGRARLQGGTGLGLAIVKRLVEAHGGWVEADSRLGHGTAIRMFFPARAAPS
ncbi:MAG: PAS domain-containing protein [Gemmatimonadetes bacterium]|nr:PAS domain-containing protein [Gemmatimonadota bacterium]